MHDLIPDSNGIDLRRPLVMGNTVQKLEHTTIWEQGVAQHLSTVPLGRKSQACA